MKPIFLSVETRRVGKQLWCARILLIPIVLRLLRRVEYGVTNSLLVKHNDNVERDSRGGIKLRAVGDKLGSWKDVIAEAVLML